MSPISNERVEHIIARLKVLDAMRKNLVHRANFYSRALNLEHGQTNIAYQNIRAEELMLAVELDVLKTDFEVHP